MTTIRVTPEGVWFGDCFLVHIEITRNFASEVARTNYREWVAAALEGREGCPAGCERWAEQSGQVCQHPSHTPQMGPRSWGDPIPYPSAATDPFNAVMGRHPPQDDRTQPPVESGEDDWTDYEREAARVLVAYMRAIAKQAAP